MSKISIRFYNDREVRAIWDEEKSKWWFSAVDIVAAITDSPNPRKYWSVMKTRMKKAENELTTKCSQLKLHTHQPKNHLPIARLLKKRMSRTLIIISNLHSKWTRKTN